MEGDRWGWSVAEGEKSAFLGPNGGGKTTTIKVRYGLLRADSGFASVAGFDLKTDGLKARAIMSYVPDEPYLYDKLTAREFLAMTCDLYAMPKDSVPERIEKVAATFELYGFMDNLIEG